MTRKNALSFLVRMLIRWNEFNNEYFNNQTLFNQHIQNKYFRRASGMSWMDSEGNHMSIDYKPGKGIVVFEFNQDEFMFTQTEFTDTFYFYLTQTTEQMSLL